MQTVNILDLAPDEAVDFRYKSGDDKSFYLKGLDWQAVQNLKMTIETASGVEVHTLTLGSDIVYDSELDRFVFMLKGVWNDLDSNIYYQDCIVTIGGDDWSLWRKGKFEVLKTITQMPDTPPAFAITMPTGEAITVDDPVTEVESVLTFTE